MHPTRLSILLSSPALLLLAACGVKAPADEGTEAGDCRDGADNDADGLFDCDDDGCAASPDCAGADENAAPSGAAIAIEPAAPGDDDDLTCTIVTEATDPNGDAVTYAYAWSKDGADAGIGSASVGAALTSGGETWTCTVTPNDGELDGATATASVTITQGNRAPSAPTVSITPAEPTDDDVLTCVIETESVDPDGDTVTYAYAWSVDGADAGITSATVNATLTEPEQAWTCVVTANDGELESASGSASVEIVPSACDVLALDGDGWAGNGTLPSMVSEEAFTVEAWVYLTTPFVENSCATAGFQTFFTFGASGGGAALTYALGSAGGGGPTEAVVVGVPGASSVSSAGVTVSRNAWHHVAIVHTFGYGTSAFRFYLDGTLLAMGGASGSTSAFPTDIGGLIGMSLTQCASGEPYHTFDGYIDSVQVRSGEPYVSDFIPGALEVDTSTIALWRGADAIGASIPDASGNDHTMTLVGTAAITTLTECPY